MRRDSTVSAPKLDAGREILRLLLPSISGTPYDRTTTLGVRLAMAWGAEIEFVHVSSSIASADPELEHRADRVRVAYPEIETRSTHLYGDDPAAAIADHSEPGTLVLMATEHMNMWQTKDSVANRMVDRIGGPVMLIGPNVPIARMRECGIDGEIVVGLDGSAAADAGIATALALAGSVGRHLWLVRVVDDPEPGGPHHPEVARHLQALAEACSEEIATRWEVIQHNDPDEALEVFATRRDAAVLVVSRRRRASPNRPSIASVTAGLVARAARPVLIVPAPEIPAVEAG